MVEDTKMSIADTNQFVKDHVTDEVFKQVVSELSDRKEKTKGGRKLKLTSEMLHNFLFYVSIGETLKNAAEYSLVGENNRKDYIKKSPTFSELSSLAQGNITLRAKIAVYKAIEGQKAQYVKIKHPITQEEHVIELKEITPNVAVAQWHLEKVNAYGNEEDDKTPQLGAPRNEAEAELLLRLMNKHSDYVRAKRKPTIKE